MARTAFPKTLGRRPLTSAQLSSDIVKTSGAQTIAGAKTFSSAAVFQSGVRLGSAAAQIVGFYNATGASQRAGSNQASSNVVTSASYGTLQVAMLQEVMNTLTGLGVWKGAA